MHCRSCRIRALTRLPQDRTRRTGAAGPRPPGNRHRSPAPRQDRDRRVRRGRNPSPERVEWMTHRDFTRQGLGWRESAVPLGGPLVTRGVLPSPVRAHRPPVCRGGLPRPSSPGHVPAGRPAARLGRHRVLRRRRCDRRRARRRQRDRGTGGRCADRPTGPAPGASRPGRRRRARVVRAAGARRDLRERRPLVAAQRRGGRRRCLHPAGRDDGAGPVASDQPPPGGRGASWSTPPSPTRARPTRPRSCWARPSSGWSGRS